MDKSVEEEMLKSIKQGDRVVRGRDWKYNDQDGNGPGTVTDRFDLEMKIDGYELEVEWDNNGNCGWYRMGVNGKYDLEIVDYVQKTEKMLGSRIFNAKKFFDFKINCGGKVFDCHKIVLSCQSDVFEAMFANTNMTEANAGEVQIDDIDPEAMETMLDFLYHEEIKDVNLINTKLLFAADKYNVVELVKICIEHLKKSLNQENALDVLYTADLTKKTDLLNAASDF